MGSTDRRSTCYAWYNAAGERGEDAAKARAGELFQQFNDRDKARAEGLAATIGAALDHGQAAGAARLTGSGSDNNAPARTHQPGSATANAAPARAAASRSANSAKHVAPLPLIRDR